MRGELVSVTIRLPLELVALLDDISEHLEVSRGAAITQVVRAGLPEWALARHRDNLRRKLDGEVRDDES